MIAWRLLHVGINAARALRSPEMLCTLRGACVWDGRTMKTSDEVAEFLTQQLLDGHLMIPIGEPCSNWNWLTGCGGHPVGSPEAMEIMEGGSDD